MSEIHFQIAAAIDDALKLSTVPARFILLTPTNSNQIQLNE